MSRMNSWKLAALFSFLVMIFISPAIAHAAVTGLAVTVPHAGDVLPAGSTASITWNSPGTVATYNLYYSLDSGTTWTTIPGGSSLPNLPGSMNYSWSVPVPPKGGNVTTAKIKVEARNSLNAIMGAAISASFTIQTLKVTSPNGGELISPKTNLATIGYTMYGSNSAVNSATLSFTTDGGTSWTAIAAGVPISAPTGSMNAYTYPWTVPAQTALRTACKVKVVIKNNSGGTIATDLSDASFTILPFFSISGTATLNAKPLSGVTVNLGGADSGTTVTDISGKYIFKNLLPGNYTVSAAKSEYAFMPALTNVALKTANVTTAGFAALGSEGPVYTLSGQVSGATGTGVLMTLTGSVNGTVMTDGSGNYSFANLPLGYYTFTPTKAGYAFDPVSVGAFLNHNATFINFNSSAVSGASFSISGKSTLNGAALPGVTIAMGGDAHATVTTDVNGNYAIKGLKNGSYTLSAVSNGYTFPAAQPETVAGANLTGVNFAATGPAFTISGHILSDNTSTFPLPSMKVTLSSSPLRTAMTDSTGSYQFVDVPNGTYTLTPSLAGASTAFYPANALVTLNGGGATRDFGAQIAYNVSGSVGYGGTKRGRIYLGLRDAGGGPARVSTSIPSPGTWPAAFTIHGVPPGSYILTARMDNLGWGTKNIVEPNTTQKSALAVTVTSANLANQNIKLFDPDLLSLQTPSVPTGLAVFPGDSTALIKWDGVYSINESRYVEKKELADSYKIYWGTDPAASNGAPITVPAYGQQLYIQTGLSDTDLLYYKISALLKGQESAASGVFGPVTIGAIETPHSVSGTVTLSAPVAASLPLYVGLYGNNGIFFTPIETLASTQSYTYTITGVPNGNYRAFAFVDLLQNNLLNVSDMSMGVDGRVKMSVVINNSDATQDITVPAANSATMAATNHTLAGTNDIYALLLRAARQKKLPVKVTLTSGPNVPVPMDIGRTSDGDPGSFGGFVNTGPFRPSGGDAYAFAVTYSDNTTESLTTTVKAVLDSFAQNPTVDPVPTDATPTFNWLPPASPPTPTYTYSMEVDEQNSGQVWSSSSSDAIISASTTSVQYNFDNSAGLASLATGTQYNWLITVHDAVGDSATVQAPSYTPGSSIFDISGTVSGAGPDGVTVTLSGDATASTTTSSGGKYSFNNLAPGSYSVTASLVGYMFSPSAGQPVTINDTDLVVNFTETPIPPHSISGQVTFGGIGFPGVTVTATGALGSSTTTDASGNYTLSGLLSGYTYTITTSKTNYTFSPANSVQPIGGGDITGVNFTTATGSGHSISGVVNVIGFAGGTGLEGVLLTLDTSPATTIVTSGTGTFSLSNIPDGTYTLTPSFAGTNAKFYPTSLPVTMNNANQINQSFGARVTFTVSGTVSYGGSQKGRVRVSVSDNGGMNTGLGTGADIITSPTTTAFTIRGVPPGSYALNAWMDINSPETGSQLATAPTGSILSVNVTNADLAGQSISIADPSPSSPGVPKNVYAFPADSAAFIMWEPPLDNNGKLLADHFVVYYDDISTTITTVSSPHLAPIQAIDNHSGIAIVSAPTNTLTNGQVYHFAVTAFLGGTESGLSTEATATIGATTGKNTISGTVYYPAEADGKNMIAGFYSDTKGVFVTPISCLTGTTASYSVAGIPGGTYSPFAVIDMNEDNTNDIGDISNTNSNSNSFVTVSGGSVTTGVDQALSGANASPLISTNHSKDGTGSESYSLRNVSVTGNKKLPVKVSLTGPLVLGPTDLDTTAYDSILFIDLNTDRPVSGDTYSFSVEYSDNITSETLTAQISAVLDSFAQNLATSPTPSTTVPTFSWQAPVSPPANATYSINVGDQLSGTQVWYYPQNGVLPTTSIQYNADGNATPLQSGRFYNWSIGVIDSNNNEAEIQAATPYNVP